MITDHELWERIVKDNEQAFATLFYRYSSKIYRSAYSRIRDSVACEQIVHDLFITLWTNRNTLKIESFNAYLLSATRYRVYKHLIANKSIPLEFKENMDAEDYSKYANVNSGYDKVVYEELESDIEFCLKGLPKRSREIFVMSRQQFLSNDEIAAELGISKRTVENQLTNALRHLRYSLKNVSMFLLLFSDVYN